MTQLVPAQVVLAKHAGKHKLSRGQQVNLLLYYLSLQQLFPEITLETFLERSLLVSGATPENRQFPKDALDHHCPNKGSAWKPAERIGIMLLFLNTNAILDSDKVPQLSLDAFLQTEAATFRTQLPDTPADADVVPDEILPGSTSRTRKPKAAAAVPVAVRPAAGSRAIYRMPLDSGAQGPERLGVVARIYDVGGTPVADFNADSGEAMKALPLTTLTVAPASLPAPASPAAATHKLAISYLDAGGVDALLRLPGLVPGKPLDDVLKEFELPIPGLGTAVFQVRNTQPKPSVDPFFEGPPPPGQDRGTAIAELPPRENSLLGLYSFRVGEQDVVIEIIAE